MSLLSLPLPLVARAPRRHGLVVAIEGIDGAGKSTFAAALAAHFAPSSVVVRFLPPETRFSKALAHHHNGLAMLAAIVHDQRTRLTHLTRRYDVVVQDRGLWTEVTHLPCSRRHWFVVLGHWCLHLGHEPDLYILIDTDPIVAYQRILDRDGVPPPEYNSQPQHLKERAEHYHALAAQTKAPCLVFDGQDANAMLGATLATLAASPQLTAR